MNPNRIPEDYVLQSDEQFLIYIGGSTTSFIGGLVWLFRKADEENTARLLNAYPEVGFPFLAWYQTGPGMTVGQLTETARAMAALYGIELPDEG